jgi:hypothetical protein
MDCDSSIRLPLRKLVRNCGNCKSEALVPRRRLRPWDTRHRWTRATRSLAERQGLRLHYFG